MNSLQLNENNIFNISIVLLKIYYKMFIVKFYLIEFKIIIFFL